MSTIDPKPRRQKQQREPKSQPAQTPNGSERTKTIVRRLPPNLPEEIFWQTVQAWVTDDTVTWKSYHPGKLRTKRVNKEGIPSRAYIAFKDEAQVATFSRAYDGHVFRDKAGGSQDPRTADRDAHARSLALGNESHAVVEYAPFQKVPTEKKKVDARNNTIDKDEDYLSFLESLKGGAKTESVSLETLMAASQPHPPPTTTPLLEALKAEKSAQRDKEAILRNHAHYKDVATASGSSKKEDAKRKAAAAAAAATAQQAKPDSPVGKKAKKAAAATAQKTQVQDSPVGTGPGLGKSGLASASVASASSPARHRPPKEPHGRSQPGKGDAAIPTPAPAPLTASVPAPSPMPAATTEIAAPSVPAPAQGQRKNRPVIGLGRHFEAALNGAGVSVSAVQAGQGGMSDRKRRDKGGEPAGAGAGTEDGGASKQGKKKHREERPYPGPTPTEVVPSILQRPSEVGAEAVVVQRAQSPRGVEGSAGHGDGAGASASARGNVRRGRGRGRSGHRGG